MLNSKLIANSKQQTTKDLNLFITWHINYQLIAFKLANRSQELGYPGFETFYHTEAADALAHTRRILNYMSYRSYSYKIQNLEYENSFEKLDLIGLFEKLLEVKKAGLELTNILAKQTTERGDNLTRKFLDWFLIDFFEEIDDHQTLIDYMKANKNNIYKVERIVEKSTEPNIKEVIKPFNEDQ